MMDLTSNDENRFVFGEREFELNLAFPAVLKVFQIINDEGLAPMEQVGLALDLLILRGSWKQLVAKEQYELLLAIFKQRIMLRENELANKLFKQKGKAFDFEVDASRISASFLMQYNIDLTNVRERNKISWAFFNALLDGLNDDTPFRKAVGFRTMEIDKDASDEQREYLKKMKILYGLPKDSKQDEIEQEFAGLDRIQRMKLLAKKLKERGEAAGLKVSASVSRFNSLKAQLGQTNIQVEQARAKFDQLSNSEDANEKETQEAANAYQELIGKQSGLAVQVGNMQQKVGNLTPTMAAAADKADALGDRFQSVGDKLSAFGQKATIGLTVPIVAGLGYAAKAAISFDSQIQSMGSLLDDGTVSAKTLQAQLNGLGDASKRWAVQYGVSTTDINNGMSELIKKGYSYNQVLGAMPSILDAARASGDDFNTVMSVSTSTLEQFGLKSNNTAQMLKNTQRVTDSLTYVANKTSAGFSDMGYAMEYVGPVAHGLNMSLEQTAAAIGLMSNQGIEGQKAGTALRGALSALLTPSKQNMEGFKNLGISVEDFKKGTITLPDILDSIKAKSKGMTDQQLQSNLALAFGTEAQSGMNILVSQGGDELRKLTGETQNATGYTKKLADTMNNTSAANVEKFKQSLNVLAINMGSKLLPTVTDLIKEGTKLVDWFSKLDEGTQKTIIKSVLAAAALGPVVSVVGKLTSGVGALFHAGSSAIQFLGRFGGSAKVASAASGALATSIGKTATGISTTAPAVAKSTGLLRTMGSALVKTGQGAGALGFALTPLGLGVVGVTAAVGLGVAAWELWGKEAVASADRASRWGTDIGAAADRSAGKMKEASGSISGAFSDTNHTVKENAKTITRGFDDITKAAKESSKNTQAALEKLGKEVGGSTADQIRKDAAAKKKADDERIKQIEANAKQAKSIVESASKKHAEFTRDQIQVLDNLRKSSAEEAVKTLRISSTQQANVLKAVNGEKIRISQAAAKEQYSQMQQAFADENDAYGKHYAAIKNSTELSASQKNKDLEILEKDHQSNMSVIYAGAIQAMKAQGLSNKTIQEQLRTEFGASASEAKKAMNAYSEAMSKGVKDSNQFAAAVSSNMSKSVQKASKDWNDLVLDHKTGEVVTNLPQVLKDTASTEKGWKRLKFDLKNAKISSNAKQMIVEAMASTEKWKSLDVPEKNAIIRASGREELADIMDNFVSWNNLSLKDQQAIVAGDYGPLVDALVKSGDWNSLTLKQMQAIVKDDATMPLMDSLIQAGKWNDLNMQTKNAILNAKGDKELQQVLIDSGVWNSLSFKDQMAIVSNKGNKELAQTLHDMGIWQTLQPKEQQAIVQAKGDKELGELAAKYGAFNKLPDSIKNALLKDEQFRQNLNVDGQQIDSFNLNKNINIKELMADGSNLTTKIDFAKGEIDLYNNGVKVGVKQFTGDSSSVTQHAEHGKSEVNSFNGTNPLVRFFPGDSSNVTAHAEQGKSEVIGFNNTDPLMRYFLGDAGGVVGSAEQGKGAVISFNGVNPLTQMFNGDASSVSEASRIGVNAVTEFGGNQVITKTFKIDASIDPAVQRLLNSGKLATGTNNFLGGLAMVNDQVGPTFRELVQLPTGFSFIPHGRNQVLPLPRGSRVLPARETARKFPGLPQFKDGLNASSIKIPKFANGLNVNKLSDASPVFAMAPEQASSFEAHTTTVEMKLNSESGKVLRDLTNTMADMVQIARGYANESDTVQKILKVLTNGNVADNLQAIADKDLSVSARELSQKSTPYTTQNMMQRLNHARRGIAIETGI